MMDWKRIQQQWQTSHDATSVGDTLVEVRQRDRTLRRQLQRRDRLETGVALVLAPVFAFAAWRAGGRAAWDAMFFSMLLALWAAYVPWHLWHARRSLPVPRHELALIDYLRQERAAMLAQARMLERIWVWYLAPCAIGVIGLNFSALGPTPSALLYAAIVLAFCLLLARLNQHVARTRFLAHAAQIERQISRLTLESGQ